MSPSAWHLHVTRCMATPSTARCVQARPRHASDMAFADQALRVPCMLCRAQQIPHYPPLPRISMPALHDHMATSEKGVAPRFGLRGGETLNVLARRKPSPYKGVKIYHGRVAG